MRRCRLYEKFYDPTAKFEGETRAFCYDVAASLIADAKGRDPDWYTHLDTVRAILLLLYCWNFAAPKTKTLTQKRIRRLLSQNARRLRELEPCRLESIDKSAKRTIASVFDSFRGPLGQTGASKALSLLNPGLFVMWDTEIRRVLRRSCIPGIGNGETGTRYVTFLEGVQFWAAEYKLASKLPRGASLAKKIDEYHYVELVR